MTDEVFGNPEADQQNAQPNTSTEANQPSEASKQEEVKPPEPVDPNSLFADQLSEIRTEDGRQKYADVPTALASIPHAQGYIAELKQQIDSLNAELEKRKSMEQLYEGVAASTSTPEPAPQNVGESEAVNLEATIRSVWQKEKDAEMKKANRAQVRIALEGKFGDKAPEVFKQKADELGIDSGFLSDMAGKSPKAVLAYFDAGNKADPTNPTSPSSINSNSLNSAPKEDTSYLDVFYGKRDDSLKEKWQKAKPTNI